MSENPNIQKKRKPTLEEKERRVTISMLRLWARKYPKEFRAIAEEMRASVNLSCNNS